jgi:hypothetical protein
MRYPSAYHFRERGMTVTEPLECLDSDSECQGAVEYRMALSGTGRSFPRCEKHWDDRLKVQEGINSRYPTMAPPDFDPLYAGEQWDDD